MKIITWNVNSIRTRLERLLAVIKRHEPDIICLQELKVTDDVFPLDDIKAADFNAAVFGQKTYNGVAILSRSDMKDVRRGFDDGVEDTHSRLISAEIAGVRIINGYFPNGGTVGSDKWQYKLAWLSRMRKLLDRDFEKNQPLLVCGDTNVAIDDKDVAYPDAWADTVHCVPEARQALHQVIDWGLRDVFREKHPEGDRYSWWDYRRLGFQRGDGLRIDHILTTSVLADQCTSAEIDRDERKGEKPSDHAPVIAVFDR